jgi:23S rRNA pseudouridine1911/1915/1917 synthase
MMCVRASSPARTSSTEAVVEVLFTDAWCLAVNKPAGVPSQPDTTGDPSVVELLADPSLGLPHRLDRPVSGVLLLTRTPEALRSANRLFAEQAVEKTYLAIVEGRVEGEAVLEHWLVHDTKAFKTRVVDGPRKGAMPARLLLKVLANGDRYTLVEVRPEGGRFHQIRAQLGAAGHPIKGDVKYGARRGEPDRSISLHARSLAFVHPVTGSALRIVAPLPTTGLWPRLSEGLTLD